MIYLEVKRGASREMKSQQPVRDILMVRLESNLYRLPFQVSTAEDTSVVEGTWHCQKCGQEVVT